MTWIENQGYERLIQGEKVKRCQIGGPPNDVDKIDMSSIMYSSDSKE